MQANPTRRFGAAPAAPRRTLEQRFVVPNGGAIVVRKHDGRPAALTIENRRGKVLGVAMLPAVEAKCLARVLLDSAGA